MNTQNQLGFIAGKIKQLETAILHCHSDSLLKLPNAIAQTLHVDEVGCVWIAIRKPFKYINEIDRSFTAGLNYYKKGAPFYLNILGIARLVIDPEELNHLPEALQKEYKEENLILCIRIREASYYENQRRPIRNTLQRWKASITSLFITDNNYYHFDVLEEKNYA